MGQRTIIYKCEDCGNETPRDELRAKRVSWYTIGAGGTQTRSRTIKWQCVPCVESDPDFQRRPREDAPGNVDWAEPA